MNFYEAPTILFAGTVVLLILGVAANATVCVVMFRSKRIWKNPSSFLVTHLSIADLLFRFVVVPLELTGLVTHPEYGNSMLCQSTLFIVMNYATVIFVTLTLIALERYTNIARPLKRLQKSTKHRFTVVAFIWTYSLVVAIIAFCFYHVDEDMDFAANVSVSCDHKIALLCFATTNHWSMILSATLYMSFGILLPVVIMVISYARITGILWRRSRTGTIHGRVARSVRKSLRMLVIIVCGFLFCWVPSIVIRPLVALRIVPCEAELALLMIAQLTQSSSSIINPIIYAVYSKDFFNDYRKFCRVCSCCRNNDRHKNSEGVNVHAR